MEAMAVPGLLLPQVIILEVVNGVLPVYVDGAGGINMGIKPGFQTQQSLSAC